MRYPPERAKGKPDLASVLKVCPQCLGDLVARSDFSGDYYCCLQCDVRTSPRNRIGRLPDLSPAPALDALLVNDFFPGADTAAKEVLMK